MIQVNLKCPQCGRSLMDGEHQIDGCPAVGLETRFRGQQGALRLSSLYGSYNLEMGVPCPEGETAQLFCPHCRKELKSTRTCELCRAPMAALAFEEGGVIQICCRRGCKKHLIEFEDPELEIQAFYKKYATLG